jgi:Serine carboxypeptidase
MPSTWILLIALLVLHTSVDAQFPPKTRPLTVVDSKFGKHVTLSYEKQSICETTPDVDQYTGYVHLPKGTLGDLGISQNYPMNTFWWYIEARKSPDTAPLTIILDGGPGASSLSIMLQDNGPCRVAEDSNSTFLNPWSWNGVSNVLYVDQPMQVGFSYDTLTNCTSDLNSYDVEPLVINSEHPIPTQNNTFQIGTLASQKQSHTSNSTRNSARAFWYFTQVWLETVCILPANVKHSIAKFD